MSLWLSGFTNFFDKEAFYNFIVSNGIVSTTAAVVIAYSAWDFIKSLVGDLLLPGLYFLLVFPFIKNWEDHSVYFAPIEKLDIANFLKNFISFFFVVFLTYSLIQHVVTGIIAIPNHSVSTTSVPTPSVSTTAVTESSVNYVSAPVATTPFLTSPWEAGSAVMLSNSFTR